MPVVGAALGEVTLEPDVVGVAPGLWLALLGVVALEVPVPFIVKHRRLGGLVGQVGEVLFDIEGFQLLRSVA